MATQERRTRPQHTRKFLPGDPSFLADRKHRRIAHAASRSCPPLCPDRGGLCRDQHSLQLGRLLCHCCSTRAARELPPVVLAFNASRTQLSLSPTTRRTQLSHNRSSSLLHRHYLPKARIERARRRRPQRKAGRPKRASASKRSGSKCCCNRSCRRQSRPGIVDLRPTTTASSGERQQSKNASRHHCKAFARVI